MDDQLQLILKQQKTSWDKFSPGWRKWDDFTMAFMQPMGDKIISALQLTETDQVLDIAGGTGEPGFTIASIVSKGKVVITDISDGMLEVARDKANAKNMTNVEVMNCDVSALPFEDASFDAVSCRFGFMFFPDMLQAAKEMVRVLKPGGRIATSVWGSPPKNFWVTGMMGIINKNMELPAPPPGTPGMFRCAAPGFIAGLFKQAGLKNILEEEISGKLNCGTVDHYWNFTTEVGAPIVAALSKADENTHQKIKTELYALLNEKYAGENVALDFAAIVIEGVK